MMPARQPPTIEATGIATLPLPLICWTGDVAEGDNIVIVTTESGEEEGEDMASGNRVEVGSVKLTNGRQTRDPLRFIRQTWSVADRNPSDTLSDNIPVGFRMDHPWTLTPHQILSNFQVDPATGLSRLQVEKHTETYGVNGALSPFGLACQGELTFILHDSTELPDDPPTPWWELVLRQFKDQLVLILLASALVSLVLALVEAQEGGSLLSALVEPLVILLILLANATVGVIQETNAEKAIDVCARSLLPLASIHLDHLRLSRSTLPKKQKSSELARISASVPPSLSQAI